MLDRCCFFWLLRPLAIACSSLRGGYQGCPDTVDFTVRIAFSLCFGLDWVFLVKFEAEHLHQLGLSETLALITPRSSSSSSQIEGDERLHLSA